MASWRSDLAAAMTVSMTPSDFRAIRRTIRNGFVPMATLLRRLGVRNRFVHHRGVTLTTLTVTAADLRRRQDQLMARTNGPAPDAARTAPPASRSPCRSTARRER